jgi:hypothetical protein
MINEGLLAFLHDPFFSLRCNNSGYTVPKAVWKIFHLRNFPGQHGDSAGSLLENFYSPTPKVEIPLGYGKISLP